MFKRMSKTLVISAMMIAMFICYFTGVSANTNEDAGWRVRITSDGTKDLIEDTKDITFEVKDNPNVAKGKIAPGTTAEATVEIDLTGTEYPVEISASIDDSNLKYENFELKTKIDGEELKGVKVVKPEEKSFTARDGKKIVTFEITWNETSEDSEIGMMGETIELPIKIKVEQHI